MKAGMSTVRLCQLFDMPERIWRRWQAKARTEGTEIQTQDSLAATMAETATTTTVQIPSWRDSETNPRKPSMTSGRSTKNCHRTTLENMPR
jgi:integrase family protein